MLSWNGLVKKIIWGDWINQPKVLSGEVEVEGHSQSRRKRGGTGKATVLTEGTEAHSPDGADKPVYRVNKDGRYICQTCEKTFKTVSCTAPVLPVDIDLRMNPYRLSVPCLVWKKVMISKLSAILFFPCLCSIKQTYFSVYLFSRQTSWEPIWSPTVIIRISPASSVGVPSAPKAPWFVTTAVTQVQWTGKGGGLRLRFCCMWHMQLHFLSPSSVSLPLFPQTNARTAVICVGSPSGSQGLWPDISSPSPPALRRSASTSTRRSLSARTDSRKVAVCQKIEGSCMHGWLDMDRW